MAWTSGGRPAHIGNGKIAITSRAVLLKPKAIPFEVPLFTLDQLKEDDVWTILNEIGSCFSDLDSIAKCHPSAQVAGAAQRALADAMMEVVESWPRPDETIKPIFRSLYARKEGAFRLRWDQLHDNSEKGKSKHRRAGQRKRLLGFPARSDFVSLLMYLSKQTSFHEVQGILHGRHVATDFYRESAASGFGERMGFYARYQDEFGVMMREFLLSIPGFEQGLRGNAKAQFSTLSVVLAHFDRFIEMVIRPFGKVTWPTFANGHPEVPQAWSKNIGTQQKPGPISNLMRRELRMFCAEVP